MDDENFGIPPEREWLTAYELSDLTGYDRYTLNKMVRDGVITPENVRRIKSTSWLFHISLVETLRARLRNYKEKQSGGPPEGTILYDGFELTPDCIYRLEAVRRQNGYRNVRKTDKTVEELIADAIEKQKAAG